jgi:hypothetical protein
LALVIGSGLGFGASSVANRHGQNRAPGFVRNFYLLPKTASLSAPRRLTQNLPDAVDCFEANRLHVRKLLTFPIVREKRIAISQA